MDVSEFRQGPYLFRLAQMHGAKEAELLCYGEAQSATEDTPVLCNHVWWRTSTPSPESITAMVDWMVKHG
jgi:hypothetical protein